MVLPGGALRGRDTDRLRGRPRPRPAEPGYIGDSGARRTRRDGDGSHGFRRSSANASPDEPGYAGSHGFHDWHVAGADAGPHGLDDADVPPTAPGQNGRAPADDDSDDGHDELGHRDADVRRFGVARVE